MLLGWRPSPRWRKEEGRGKEGKGIDPGPFWSWSWSSSQGRTEKGARTTPTLRILTTTHLQPQLTYFTRRRIIPSSGLTTPHSTTTFFDLFSSSPSVLFLPQLLALLCCPSLRPLFVCFSTFIRTAYVCPLQPSGAAAAPPQALDLSFALPARLTASASIVQSDISNNPERTPHELESTLLTHPSNLIQPPPCSTSKPGSAQHELPFESVLIKPQHQPM